MKSTDLFLIIMLCAGLIVLAMFLVRLASL